MTTNPAILHLLLTSRLSVTAMNWLTTALDRIAADHTTIRALFPTVGRHCGREGLLGAPDAHETSELHRWSVDDAARTLMLAALPLSRAELGTEVAALYRYGDAAEKRGVLRGLGSLDSTEELDERALPLVHDGLRTNDTRIITAAMAAYGARRLDQAAYRQGVLKCVFLGIPLSDIDGLDARGDAELVRMLTDYARERRAAGRDVPADVWRVVDPNELSRET
ncbi:hypothetical protein FHX42_002255 [Saccharopolyspora lacisalsi]|uniref:Sugar phosphate isomerase n=1 Tax=Halosaccharopolyspora lacisalsi TaxID=1000566 RepID=A0A839E1T4_9PSEU|nr:EboA domain-containing protein [Halosaccharopolyspora lacisalsi]MBA8824908.1 hypothetical protein [Halosaccharopolyspora lacisalsi]